jgi:hypothetical protein
MTFPGMASCPELQQPVLVICSQVTSLFFFPAFSVPESTLFCVFVHSQFLSLEHELLEGLRAGPSSCSCLCLQYLGHSGASVLTDCPEQVSSVEGMTGLQLDRWADVSQIIE